MPDVPVDLYRSCKSSNWTGKSMEKKEQSFVESHGKGSLYPDYVGFTRNDGTVRAPDVTTMSGDGGVLWVRGVEDRNQQDRPIVSWKEGVSVSTMHGGFGYKGWFYFLLPKNTPVPDSLDIIPTPTRNDGGHYSIRCKNLMRQDAYEGALDNLARAAVVRAVELSRQSLYFS